MATQRDNQANSEPAHVDDYRRSDPSTCTHPLDLAEHLAYEHRLGSNLLQPGFDRELLELCHTQRHDGFGVGADHPRDHGHREGGFS